MAEHIGVVVRLRPLNEKEVFDASGPLDEWDCANHAFSCSCRVEVGSAGRAIRRPTQSQKSVAITSPNQMHPSHMVCWVWQRLVEDDRCVDSVFDADCSSLDVYSHIGRPIIDSFVKGINGMSRAFYVREDVLLGTIMAYGQTSSGKTYTMYGEENAPGLIFLATKDIMAYIQNVCQKSCPDSVGKRS